jgi:hypothetical protein
MMPLLVSCYCDGRFLSSLDVALAIASDVPFVCDYCLACLLRSCCPIAVMRCVLQLSRLNVVKVCFLMGLMRC